MNAASALQRPRRLLVRIGDFQSPGEGSIPSGVTKLHRGLVSVKSGTEFSCHMDKEARDIVSEIMLLKPGGHIYVYFATFHDKSDMSSFTIRSTLKGAQHTAMVWGLEARAAAQVRVEWDDGAQYREPWVFYEQQHDEESCPICCGTMML